MQDSVDRYGSPRGNFVAGIENGEPASFESRSTPYIKNPESYLDSAGNFYMFDTNGNQIGYSPADAPNVININ